MFQMDAMQLREQIYRGALPLLKGRRVTDLVVGLSMLAVELDEKDLGIGYVLRDELGGGCSIFPYASGAVGMSAEEVGRWFVDGGDDVQRGIGGAVINAASQALPLQDQDSQEEPFGLCFKPTDTIGMVGMIRPVIMRLKRFGCRWIIFDKGKCANGNAAEDIYPMERQAELLPQCDVVFLSGTTTINGSAAPLLELTKNARAVVLVGSSVPMIPEGYAGTNVTVLAGSWWRHEDKEELFRLISQAAGMQTLGRFMVKKNVHLD